MAMHEIEDCIEEAIRVVSRSDMPVSEKRNMVYSLLRLEEYGDCGFTNLRTLKEMMDCQYTFVFDKTEMYDYEANRGYYDGLSKKGGCSQGAPYTLVARDAVTDEWVRHDDKVCVDSGSEAWRGMVAAGAIAGEGAAGRSGRAANGKEALGPDGRLLHAGARRPLPSFRSHCRLAGRGVPRTLRHDQTGF